MPSCGKCRSLIFGRDKYCTSCRCTAASCGLPKTAGSQKCRNHSGKCFTETCKQSVTSGPPRIFCTACKGAEASAAPTRRRPVASDTAATQTAENIKRKASLYAAKLTATLGTREHLALVLAAVEKIAETKLFNQYLTELTGWKNLKSWTRWALNSLEPSMMAKMRYVTLVEGLTPVMLAAGMRNAYFAERFLEEMVLICLAEQDKADVSFIVGQTFSLFGPLLAPLSAAAGSAVGGGIAALGTKGAITAGKTLTQMGLTAGAKALALDPALAGGMSLNGGLAPIGFTTAEDWDNIPTRARSATIYSAPAPSQTSSVATAEERYHYSANPMQYASCLFKYLTNLRTPSRSEQLVIDEFGGIRQLTALYDFIKHPPM